MSSNAMTPDRLRRKLEEQLGFIERSAAAYDQGHEAEALRLATTLRVLLHGAQTSHALLSQLGIRDATFLSSSRGHGDWRDYLVVHLDLNRVPPISARPFFGTTFRPIPFGEWWSRESVFVHASKHYTRSQIVLSAANKDGGAHVDPQLEEYYDYLCRGEYLIGITGNLTIDGPAPWPQGVTIYPINGHFALLRQFAHEVLATAAKYDWLAAPS